MSCNRAGRAADAGVGRSRYAAMLLGVLATLPHALPVAAQVRAPQRQQGVASEPGAATLEAWSRDLWHTAHVGQESRLRELLERVPQGPPDQAHWSHVLETASRLKASFAQREMQRNERRNDLTTRIDGALAKAPDDKRLSDALRWATELQMLSGDREAALQTPLLRDVIVRASQASREAERRGDWLVASELFYRLHALTEERGTYKEDMERLNQRLTMLRLYVPHQLWELRRLRMLRDDANKPFPAYNPIGMGYDDRLADIDDKMVMKALVKTTEHVDRVPMASVLAGGLKAVRTMVTTTDLKAAFAGLNDADASKAMVAFLDAEIAALPAGANVPMDKIEALLTRLSRKNGVTVALPWNAILHEFGNGAVGELDEFSVIIWPDEIRRFQRTTQGRVVGIGVQLEYDEQQNIRIATPISGAPADRVGIRSNDVIARVDGQNTLGMSLDQAIDLITGPMNTEVVIGINRVGEEGKVQELEFPIRRAIIDITTVKGWKRTGLGERDWDYFIDGESGVGYVRLSQFTDTTTRDFDRAIATMRTKGLNALILDLRYNPGGLLDEAIRMSQRFIDVDRGTILRTRGQGGIESESPEVAEPAMASLAHIPVAILINENSASASEIVSGALRYYSHTGLPNNQPALRGILVGQRSYGKGSVQTLTQLGTNAMTKITVQYYFVPDEVKQERIVHRRPGAKDWGIVPDLALEILPKQAGDALVIRRNADIARPGEPLPIATKGPDGEEEPTSSNPQDLLTLGLDMQLDAALLLMQSEVAVGRVPQARAAR